MSAAEMSVQYPHLNYRKIWEITPTSWVLLGQCEAYVRAMSNTPILPDDHRMLLQVSLIKGALATTAIEGNTLTEAEASRVLNGEHLEPSKEYQAIEVKNVIEAFNRLFDDVVVGDGCALITPQLLKDFHRMIGRDLGEHFDAIPGQFRTDNRAVGPYRAPDYKYVESLVSQFCDWLRTEFHYTQGQQFYEVIIQAIVAHVFLEWIHPFGDGNGRTGRLLEFYILLRGGLPDIASHILSNHYNQTRSQYYRELNNARHNQSLTQFIDYALLGFRDGLANTMGIIQSSQFKIAWDRFVYDAFDKVQMKNKSVFKRRRKLILDFPLTKAVPLQEVSEINVSVAKLYGGLSARTVHRDVAELAAMKLLIRDGDTYKANVQALMMEGHLPRQKRTS